MASMLSLEELETQIDSVIMEDRMCNLISHNQITEHNGYRIPDGKI